MSEYESWIRTASGGRFDPFHPDPAAITIEDIALSLSRQCRFSGHTRQFYSVAQHSVLVSEQVPKELALRALLHDASEAYVVDIPSPIKRQPALAAYREIEDRVMVAVGLRFNFEGNNWWKAPEIKQADTRVCAAEARDLMPGWEEFPSRFEWDKAGGPLKRTINPMRPEAAKAAFLARFVVLDKLEDGT